MSGVTFIASRSWRRRAGWSVVVIGVVAVMVAVPLALVAGARRSSTAFDRFVSESKPFAGVVEVTDLTTEQIGSIRRLPELASSNLVGMAAIGPSIPIDEYLPIALDLDGGYGSAMGRATVVEGRRPDPAAVDEVLLGPARAKLLGVGLGDTLELVTYTPAQAAALNSGDSRAEPEGPRLRLKVVGLGILPSDLASSAQIASITVLPKAVADRYGDRIGGFGHFLAVSLAPGSGGPAFVAAVHRQPGLSEVFIDIGSGLEGSFDLLSRLVVGALLVVALIVVLASAVTLSIVLSRLAASTGNSDDALRAIGLRRSERIAAVALVNAPSISVGMALGLIGAVLLSPLMPFGLLGQADPDRGIHADWLVLATGLAVAAAILAMVSWNAARRVTRRPRPPRESGRAVQWLTRRDLGIARLLGVRYVLDPNSVSGGVPARSAVGGFMAGTAAVVGAVVFAASLSHLLVTPSTYGWGWDNQVNIDDQDSLGIEGKARLVSDGEAMMIANRAVQDAASIQAVSVNLDGPVTQARAVSVLKGSSAEVILEGRGPAAGEIALGTDTIERLHTRLDASVPVVGGSLTRQLRVVGRAAFVGLTDVPAVADGALLSPDDAADFVAAGADSSLKHVVRFAPGVDRVAAAKRLETEIGFPLTRPAVPDEIRRIRDVRFLPWVVVGFLALSSLVAAGYFLVVATTRRRRGMAVLRTLGMEARGVRQVVTWQGLTISVLGLLIGLPVGVLVGRALWRLVADGLGVVTAVTVPAPTLVLVAVVALAIGPVLAIGPARAAARRRPAEDLRAPD